MAQLVLTAVGTYLGGPLGGTIGSFIGANIDASRRTIEGPRLSDGAIMGTAYGEPIPYILASKRVAGQLWWASERREIASSSGGKGGGPRVTTYSYEVDCLFGLSCNEQVGLSRIWLNGKLIWTHLPDADEELLVGSRDTALWRRLTFYGGASDQLPDPTYEAAVGTADAIAYRGRATVFIEGLDLGSAGQLPNLTFEVATDEVAYESPVLLHLDYTSGSVNDQSCDSMGAPSATIASYTLSDTDGLVYAQSFDPSIGGTEAFEFAGTARFDLLETTWTLQAIISEETLSTTALSYGATVIVVGRSGTISNYAIAVTMDSTRTHRVTFNQAFSGSAYTYYSGGFVHIAIVHMAAGSTRCYVDGTHVVTFPDEMVFGAFPQTISVGGIAGVTPVLSQISTVKVRQVQLTRAELYTGTASFVPPTVLEGPFCDPLYDPGTITIRQAVEALCDRAGIAGADVDAADLDAITMPVRSYSVSQVAPTRAALEQLQAAYRFICLCTDKLRFKPLPETAVALIPYSDLAAAEDTAADEPLAVTVQSDLELPPQTAVRYINVLDDYNVGTEQSDRVVSTQQATQVTELPIGLTPAEAKGVADRTVLDAAIALTTTKISLDMRYAALEPGDIVRAIDGDDYIWRFRLGRKEDAAGVMTFDAARVDRSLSSELTDDDGYTYSRTPGFSSATEFLPLDIPLLRDADDDPGYYVVAKGATTVWPGAAIYSSLDDLTLTQVATVPTAGVFGATTTALGDWTGGDVFDEINSVTVDVGNGTLSSTTRDGLLADGSVNACVVGDELIRYITATLQGAGIYKLTRLLRGQKGTEWATGDHVAGDQFALLTATTVRSVVTAASEIGQARYLRGVTLGRSLDSAESEAFTQNAVRLKPLAPVGLRAAYEGDGIYTVTWNRRTRMASRFVGSQSVPLGEDSEAYDVELYDADSPMALASTTRVTTASVSVAAATEVATLPVGVWWITQYGGNYFGMTFEGDAYGLKFLAQQTEAGALVSQLYLGRQIDAVVVVGANLWAKVLEVTSSGSVTASTVYRVDLTAPTATAASYSTTTTADIGWIAHDGTYLWASEPSSQQLKKLNATTLAAVSTHVIGTSCNALAHLSGNLYFADDVSHQLIKWSISGTSETWRVSTGSAVFVRGIYVAGSLVFCAFDDGYIRVYAISDGSLVATHAGTSVGRPAFTAFGGEVVSYVRVTGGYQILMLNATTGAEARRLRTGANDTHMGGAVGSSLWLNYADSDYTDMNARAYELASSLAGYTVRVYQISAVVGRGYSADMNL